MNILVTGSAGFIASKLVERLKEDHLNFVEGFDLTKGQDLRDMAQVRRAVEYKDVVFHLAAVADLNWARINPDDTESINVRGTWNVAQACSDFGAKMFFASTCCFPPDTWVRMKDSVKKIADVQVGDSVVTHTGECHSVTQIGQRPYDGGVVSLSSIGNLPITSTPEHRYLVWAEDGRRWVPAQDIKVGDKLVIPSQKRNTSPNGLDCELAYLWGLYVAEGHVCHDRNHRSISFNFGDEPELIKAVSDTMMAYYDKEAAIVDMEYLGQKGARVTFYGEDIAREFHQFYEGSVTRATTKVIPTSVLNASEEVRLAFLHGYIDGDGCYYKSAKTGSLITMTTVSAKLAWQVKSMFADMQILAAISHHQRSDTILGRNVNCHQGYTLNIRGKDACYLFDKFGHDNWDYRTISRQKYWKDNGDIVTKVYKVERSHYVGPVYNLEIETDNSYTANCIAVHNCVYGNQAFHPVTEESLPRPAEIYAASKLAGEALIKGIHYTYGLDYNLMRFATIYGPGTRPALATHIFMGQALRGEPITVHGNGTQTRTLTYVDDLVDGIIALWKSEKINDVWNLTTEEEVSALQMAEDIKRITKSEVPITFIPQRVGQTFRESISAGKMRREVGWQAKTKWEAGIQKMYRWFLLTNQVDNRYHLPEEKKVD